MMLILLCNAPLWLAIGFLLWEWYYRPMPDRVIRKFRTFKRVIKVWAFHNRYPEVTADLDRWLYRHRNEIDQADPLQAARAILNDFASVQAVEVMDGSMTHGCMIRR